jgi:hypothetical protein
MKQNDLGASGLELRYCERSDESQTLEKFSTREGSLFLRLMQKQLTGRPQGQDVTHSVGALGVVPDSSNPLGEDDRQMPR